MEKTQRLQSLDALRGFDMLFIMGGSGFFVALHTMFPNAFFGTLARHMEHVPWDGFVCYDMIFPLFLFIAGISFPFSLAKQRSKGIASRSIYLNIIRRGLILVLFGAIYNGLLTLNFADVRYCSVLGRIGLACMFAALIYVNFGLKVRMGIAAFILLGYWALLALVPAPDAIEGVGVFSKEGSLVGYIDRIITPGRLLFPGLHDPEGLLSTLPAIVTAMLGMFVGDLIRMKDEKMTENRKVLTLIIAGVALVIVGQVWNLAFPINKNLWSSSFVCFVGGLSMLLFALFYYIIDVKGYKKWTLFFTVIGMNSITIYMAQKVINFRNATDFLFGGLATVVPVSAHDFILACGYIAVCWTFLYFLYKKGVFLKV